MIEAIKLKPVFNSYVQVFNSYLHNLLMSGIGENQVDLEGLIECSQNDPPKDRHQLRQKLPLWHFFVRLNNFIGDHIRGFFSKLFATRKQNIRLKISYSVGFLNFESGVNTVFTMKFINSLI